MINEKGMYLDYTVAHEDSVWKIRCEPGVTDVLEEIPDTSGFLVWFDAVNFWFDRPDVSANGPWPHEYHLVFIGPMNQMNVDGNQAISWVSDGSWPV